MSTLLTFDEVALRLTVSRRTVERLVQTHKLRATWVSERRRAVSEADLDIYVRTLGRRAAR